VIRRLAPFIAVAALSAANAAADPQPAPPQGEQAGAKATSDLSAESVEEVNGETILRGKAALVDPEYLLNADEIRYNRRTSVAQASGNVVLTRVGDRILADTLTINRATGAFTATNLRIGKFPFYVQGPTAEGSRKEVIIHDSTVTYGEPGRWQPTIKARTITYSPGHYLRISGAEVGVGGYRPIPVSHMAQDLARETGLLAATLDGGYRRNLGPYLDAAMHYPLLEGLTAGPDIGVYGLRGLMLGPVMNYDIENGDNSMKGYLRSGYIYDFGDRLTDILNNPVPPNRAYAEWHHNQEVNGNLEITGDVNWSTDSEVIRDFHSKEFVPIQEPDNYVEAVYAGPDFLASAFTRFQPDAFYPAQQRAPELKFDLLPTRLGGGIYVRFDAGVAHLDEVPPDGGAHLEADRFDTFLGLSRPLSYKGIINFTPVAGARFTDYWDTLGAQEPGGASRALGEVGFDFDMKFSGTWNYKNPILHIDGLRHLITPEISYRYIPDGNKSSAWIPPIDRETFSTYLPILELGDMRALDQIQAENVARFGLKNTLQTRNQSYGSRDLLSFDIEDDVKVERDPTVSDFSDIYAELRATPARWLELSVEDSVSSNGLAQRARDATVTFKQGEVWSVGFGVGYLSNNYGSYYLPGLGPFPIEGLDTYHVEARDRLNEVYEVFARGDYDYYSHLWVDEFYGFSQKISNTWIVEYALVFSNGPNKGQGHFGLNATLNLIRF
jgi:LPS-assembly protein